MSRLFSTWLIFFFNDTATTEIYTLSLHDALPIWLTVEYASTFLMSSYAQPQMHPYSRVIAPTMVTTVRPVSDRSYSGFDRAIRYTPAVTMVAAWISADTGVGPSIASGNQVCSGNWPD